MEHVREIMLCELVEDGTLFLETDPENEDGVGEIIDIENPRGFRLMLQQFLSKVEHTRK